MRKVLTILMRNKAAILRLLVVVAVAIGLNKLSSLFTTAVTRVYDSAKAAPIVLKAYEKAKVEIRGNMVRHVTRGDGGKVAVRVTYLPPEGKVTVVEPLVGDMTVKVKDRGLTFHPGAGFGVVGTAAGGFGYVKLAYYRRLGLTAGLGFNTRNDIIPFAGCTYHVKSNTFLLVGIGTEAKAVVGLAWNF